MPVGAGNVVTVITVPKSRTIHQTKDGRYYRRRNFRNDIMEDYEIREAFNRTTTPDLYISFLLEPGPPIEISPAQPFSLYANIGNRSKQPSFYTVVHLFADHRLEGGPPGYTSGPGAITNTGVQLSRWTNKLGIPGNFPIFMETEFSVMNAPWAMTIPAALTDSNEAFIIGYLIVAPGFSSMRFAKLILANRRLTLEVDPLAT